MGLTLLRLLETPHLRSKKQYVRDATSAAAVLDLFKQIWLTTQPKVHCRRHEWEIKLLISLVLLTDSIFFFLRGQVVRKARMRETDWCQCLIFKPYRKWTFTLQAGLRIDLDGVTVEGREESCWPVTFKAECACFCWVASKERAWDSLCRVSAG